MNKTSVIETDHLNPLPENIRSVQPGGGVCYSMELAWGHWRRWFLKTFRPAYVARMKEKMLGSTEGAPHEILDSRDLKYCCNLCTARWPTEDDPFVWRDNLPLVRWGLAEVQIMGWPLAALAIVLLWLGQPSSWFAVVPLVTLGLVLYFFRDPPREIPQETDAIVSPADGTIVEVAELEHYDFLDGPAVRVSIFLSIFNAHINRAPRAAEVVEIHYKPGEFLDARDPESAIRNEFIWIGLQETGGSRRKLAVRAISGLCARRIVCVLRPGSQVKRGEKFGMIKLGSRTELILPRDEVEVGVKVGEKVQAGRSVLARYLSN